MSSRNIIVVGASAGGVEALQKLAGGLPTGLQAAVFVVLHQLPTGKGLLPQLLNRAGPLPARDASDGELIENGRIYTAPPDRHLLLENNRCRVVRGPRENFSRPAVDPLFRSAAQEFGRRVVGVILSGTLNDGTGGLWAIKQRGGVAVVQIPGEAAYAGMPQSAVDNVEVDYVLPLTEIAPQLLRLIHEPATYNAPRREDRNTMSDAPASEFEVLPEIVTRNQTEQRNGLRHGQTSLFSCPECGGVLWQADADGLTQFRCHVGHAYTGQALADGQSENVERSLWYAVRTLADRGLLLRQLAHIARERGDTESAVGFDRDSATADAHKAVLQQIVEGRSVQLSPNLTNYD